MISTLLKIKTNNVFIQLFRYTFVGGIAFLGDFGTLFLLTEYFKIYYLTSAAFAFLVGIIINYVLSISWVFHEHKIDAQWVEFLIYGFIGIVGLGLNEFFIWFFTEKLHLYYLLSKIVSTGFVYFWNFFVRKFTLFC